MALRVLVEGHQLAVFQVAAGHRVVHRRHHDAVDGVGAAGGGNIDQYGPQVQQNGPQQRRQADERDGNPYPHPLMAGQANIAQARHGHHLPLWEVYDGTAFPHSCQPLTMDLKNLPRSAKFLNWSKAAQAGDSVTTSPGQARSRAASTAAVKGVTSSISGQPGR